MPSENRRRLGWFGFEDPALLEAKELGGMMEGLVGFHVGFWDYVTFGAMAVIVMAFLTLAVFILGLPGRIAIARNHPEADAIYLMGWIGFLAVVPWIQALIWAFKPTDVIDIRHLPKETAQDTEDIIARLTGQTPSPKAPPIKSPERD